MVVFTPATPLAAVPVVAPRAFDLSFGSGGGGGGGGSTKGSDAFTSEMRSRRIGAANAADTAAAEPNERGEIGGGPFRTPPGPVVDTSRRSCAGSNSCCSGRGASAPLLPSLALNVAVVVMFNAWRGVSVTTLSIHVAVIGRTCGMSAGVTSK